MAAGAALGHGLSSRDALRAFADVVLADAARAAGDPAADLVIAPGGVRIRIRVAGAEHARRLMPALTALAVDGAGAADIDIVAFDGGPGGTQLAPPPWGRGDYRPRDELAGFGDEQLEVSFSLAAETLNLADGVAARAVSWARDPSRLPVWDTGAPLRTILRWAVRGHGLQLVHGAVVGDERGGVLLAGGSGSGKSTTALACALLGLRFVGDDFCAVATGDEPAAHALYAIAKVDDSSVRLLPQLRGHAAWEERTLEGKVLIAPDSIAPGALARELPLRAIVLPRVGARTGSPQPATAAHALLALAPSTLIQLPGSRPVDHEAMAALARGLPAFSLELGPDPAAVVAAVGSVLDRVS